MAIEEAKGIYAPQQEFQKSMYAQTVNPKLSQPDALERGLGILMNAIATASTPPAPPGGQAPKDYNLAGAMGVRDTSAPQAKGIGVGEASPVLRIVGTPNPNGANDTEYRDRYKNPLSPEPVPGMNQPLFAPPYADGISPAATKQEVLNTGSGVSNAEAIRNKNDALYAAINRLDDKKFLQFMKDHPDFPGLGYVKDEQSGKLLRFAENPDKKKKEPMSPIEMEGVSKALTGMGHFQAGIGAREHAEAAKQASGQYRQEALWEKSDKSLQDIIGVLGKDSLTGEINPELAYYKMGRDNVPLHKNLSPESREFAQQAINTQMQPLLDDVSAFEAQYKRKPTDAEKLTITKAYEKRRGWSF